MLAAVVKLNIPTTVGQILDGHVVQTLVKINCGLQEQQATLHRLQI